MTGSARVLRLDELESIRVAGVTWRPVRRALGVTAFGINAYSAAAGEELIERHDESGEGAGSHEELYVVVRGHARFTVAGEEIDAAAGTVVFIPDPRAQREAVAVADDTMAVAVGGAPGTITPSAWEHYFAAVPAREAGDLDGAIATVAAGLDDHPDHPRILYELACLEAVAGRREEALGHLRRAVERAPRLAEWAADDADFDSVRDDPAFPR